MAHRRDFMRAVVSGAAGLYAMTRSAAAWQGQPARRQVTIGGRRIRVIDGHAHCVIPVQHVIKGTPLEKMGGGGNRSGPSGCRSWISRASMCRR